jgi:hypothetical protein
VKVADARRLLEAAGGVKGLEKATGINAKNAWGGQCHGISLAVVRTGLLGEPGTEARVARGFAKGVRSQHSWIVLGGDPYDTEAVIADPTIWHYQGAEPYVHLARNTMRTHVPHGSGSIWATGAPPEPQGNTIALDWQDPPSGAAQAFLEACGPLDLRGWMFLANSPVTGWPAREILSAVADTPGLGRSLIPIDILGMLTDRNPKGLYW